MTTTSPPPRPPRQTDDGVVAVAAPTGGVPVVRSRRVRLTVQRVDPWTVLRLSFLLSVAVAIVTVVSLMLMWGLLSAGGVFDSVQESANDILGESSVTFTQYFDFGRVLWLSLLLAVADVVLVTALATVAAFLFNLAVSIAGGLEVSVTEES